MALLLAAGQPLFAEDSWWHLGMGRAYAAQGPWLAGDPFLFDAAGVPAPAAWLFGLALHGVEQLAGFPGLRGLHALLVAAILVQAWRLLRAASGSAAFASVGSAVFGAMAAFRLFQLRPHLATILATLLLLHWLLARRGGPLSRGEIAGLVVGFGLWANLHGGVVLGLALLGVATLASALDALAARDDERWQPVWGRALALICAGLGALANPAGPRQLGLLLAAGSETPELSSVGDEWASWPLLQMPLANLPPSPLDWALGWLLLLALPAGLWLLRGKPRVPGARDPREPSALAIAALGLAAMFAFSRFQWLGIAAIAWLGSALAARGALEQRAARWTLVASALALLPLFAHAGSWPMISRGVEAARYERPYPAEKFRAHAVWFLADARLEGRLWNDYQGGNFLGYWLAPRLRVFVNGSLNVSPQRLRDNAAIRARTGSGDDEFEALLDHYRIDVFLGTGHPVPPRAPRPNLYTTTHLERSPGWIAVFRNIESAIYLRRDPRNRENLRRVGAYYAARGVPFDAEHGLDLDAVLDEAPGWARRQGVIPTNFETLQSAAHSYRPAERRAGRARLAVIDALLGRYGRAAELEGERLEKRPDAIGPARRQLWSLLRNGDPSVPALADRVEGIALAGESGPGDALAMALVSAARELPGLSAPEAAARLVSLPLLYRQELGAVLLGFAPPEARLRPGPADAPAPRNRARAGGFRSP